MNRQIKLTLPEEVCQELTNQASAQGLTLASYVRLLVYRQLQLKPIASRRSSRSRSVQKEKATWKEIADLL
ncbi:MAG: hypothetical protein Q4G02_01930 [bacterium]|nr:hypothetical protein [bacterium]